MTETATLLLTSPDSRMVSTLSRLRPDIQVIPLGQAVPLERFRGTVWGFVDWLLPELSGLELCRRLRESSATRRAHLTIVLDESSQEAKRRALQAGADDYLVGPLDAARLLERMAGLAAEPAPTRLHLQHGAITLDLGAHQIKVAGQPVPMRPNEFRLLAHFMEHPDQVFSRTALIDRLGKDGDELDERTVDVWVGRLRRALAAHGAPDPLRTVRALGYVLDSVES